MPRLRGGWPAGPTPEGKPPIPAIFKRPVAAPAVSISTELAEAILAQLSRRLPDEDAVHAMVELQDALAHESNRQD